MHVNSSLFRILSPVVVRQSQLPDVHTFTKFFFAMNNQVFSVKRHTAIISALMLLSCLLMVTVPGAKAGIPESDAEPTATTSNCECLAAEEPCADLLQNCQDTASENYENGDYNYEQYVMFSTRYCIEAFLDCVEDLYGDQ